MILFKDVFTKKEILTDSYSMKLIDDFVYEVTASYVTKSGDNFGDKAFGGNPSAEEAANDMDEPTTKNGYDVVLNHEDVVLYDGEECNSLKAFKKLLKKILSFAKEVIPKDRYESLFKPKMIEFFGNQGLGNTRFSNFQIFFSSDHLTEDGDIKAGPIFLDADDTGMKAKVYYFKDLMEEEKQ